jgi:hypothetical protein
MSIANSLHWLHDTHFSIYMRESLWAEPVVESVHVLTLTLFIGFSVMLDMRLLGVSWRRKPASLLLKQLNPWLGLGFAIMVITGVLLFCGDPVRVYATIFFKAKMVMIVLAGLNVLIFNATLGRRVAEWDLSPRTPGGAKFAAIVGLVLWVAIVAAGRAIAYALPPP